MTRRRVRLGALAAVAAGAIASLAAGGGVAAESTTNLRAAQVHPKLLDQLHANPTGGVTAIVTAWGRDGLDDITSLGVTGTTLKVLPMVITQSLTMAELEKLRASPAVRSVWPEERYEILMEDSTWITKARYVWASSPASGPLKGFGVTGNGIELAMIDTGFDGKHEDGDNLIEFCESITSANGVRTEVLCTPWDSDFNPTAVGVCGAQSLGDPAANPPPYLGPYCDSPARGDSTDPDVSHGTHVGGTVLGTGHASGGKGFNHSTIGLAPDAKFRAYKAGTASLLSTWTLAAYDDMTYKKEQGYSKVIAVNNSWGGTGGANYDPASPTAVAVRRAYQAGIVSVFAAGNSGPEHNTLSPQCVIPYVVCVAASTKPDSIVAFSSKGRPSQPSDTNRDGTISSSDVQPDNHDRRIGIALEKGLYRPTLAAPGVNINSMKAIGANIGGPDSAACREDLLMGTEGTKMNCYVQANGTSMATPHVTGAIGLIGQAFRQERGRLPRPAEIIDILERSANTAKLPGWDAEEQGAGRLDVHQAVRYAKGEISLRRPNFGYPTPPYVSGMYPGSSTTTTTFKGCTQVGSWTARDPGDNPEPPVGQPPAATAFYGQHFINVLPNTDRIRITVTWPNHAGANLYARLWRPGVDPSAESATPDAGPPPFSGRPSAYHQSRVFPDQEGVGIPTGAPPTYRLLEVRAPEETTGNQPAQSPPAAAPSLPSGLWVLRVYNRHPGANVTGCGVTQENPQVPGRVAPVGYEYNVKLELPRVTYRPSARIESSLSGTQTSRFVDVDGRAGYPPHRVGGALKPTGAEETSAPPLGHVGYSWEGITNWEVPGSSQSVTQEPEEDNRPFLYMHGQSEEGCSGNGELDVDGCNGPFLLPKTELSANPVAAFWQTGIEDEVFDGTIDRTQFDPNWTWCLAPGEGCPLPGFEQDGIPAGAKTVGGPMTVVWWAKCSLCGGIFSADWFIRVWADGVLKFEQRVSATPPVLGQPGRVSATVTLPTFTANQRIVLHLDPVFVDSQTVTFIYYDSAGSSNCLSNPNDALSATACDSHVRMPVTTGSGGQTDPTPTPENVRVTDLPANPAANHPYPQSQPLSPALRVAWDKLDPAPSRYEVYKSMDPLFPGGGQRINGPFVDCVSPQAATPGNPPGHDRSGLCYTDTSVSFGTAYYYRVVAVKRQNNQDVRSANSEIAYGMPTRYDRQVKLKVDRLYGPQYWEYALVPPSPTPQDTTNTGVQWAYLWDTLELVNGTYTGFPGPFTLVPGAHKVFARSFTQGIGSTKDGKTSNLDDDPGPGPGPGPGCPDDDDGDGDDDDDDGDSDDDGDDRDDDCEDDDDDEEEDDD
jgi:serine protease AprX